VWYLLVKPSIDSHRLPSGGIPEIIPLGGIRECLRKIGWTIGGHQGHELIKALTQIAFAGCVADLWVPTGEHDIEGKERFLQIKGRFSRMSVYAIGEHHLTDEELAQKSFDFDLEDVLYIRLDPLEAKLQQLQDRRILDNQYLFSVNPAGRRWYELMGAKIFGVVKNKAEFCEIRYSWYIKHHHTLKRAYEHKRVRFQMDRVVRDHLASGYLTKVEYRAIKEPDQELDYIIRYFPGPGAGDSIVRIQGHIKKGKTLRRLPIGRAQPILQAQAGQGIEATTQPVSTLALSVITAHHEKLIAQLIIQFGIHATKAYQLVVTKKEPVVLQLEAWPFRDAKPRNLAGWMIQAIEGNYQIPQSYHDEKRKRRDRERLEAAHAEKSACAICRGTGFRAFKSAQYPNGAMRKCTHDLNIEVSYRRSDDTSVQPNAVDLPLRDDFPKDEKGPGDGTPRA
jgi:hypothetical protein